MTGQIDLIALVRVRAHEDVADVVADRLNKVPGVTSTETHIAFRAYSRHDLDRPHRRCRAPAGLAAGHPLGLGRGRDELRRRGRQRGRRRRRHRPERHPDHHLRLAGAPGRRREGRQRGLLRPSPRQVRQQPADQLVALRQVRRLPAPRGHLGQLRRPDLRPRARRLPGSGPRSSKTVQDVVFDWDPVQGAKHYEIWVALDQRLQQPGRPNRPSIGTRYSPSTTYDNNNYFWKVRPINAADQPAPWPQPAQRVPAPLAGPADARLAAGDCPPSAVGDDFYYQWTPVRHASKYQLDIGTDPNFTPTTPVLLHASTTYAAGYEGDDACMPSQGQLYYWRVRALDGPRGVEGIYSDTDPVAPATRATSSSTTPGAVQPAEPGQRRHEHRRPDPAVGAEPGRRAIRDQVSTTIPHRQVRWGPYYGAVLDPGGVLDPDFKIGPFYWTVRGIDADGRVAPLSTPAGPSTCPAPPAPTGTAADPAAAAAEPVDVALPPARWTADHRCDVLQAAGLRDARASFCPRPTDVLGRQLKSTRRPPTTAPTSCGPAPTPGGSRPTTRSTRTSPCGSDRDVHGRRPDLVVAGVRP